MVNPAIVVDLRALRFQAVNTREPRATYLLSG